MPSMPTTRATTPSGDEYARLEAESHDLAHQRDIALAADPRSEMYRHYVARMQAHIAALAVYLDVARPAA